MSSEFPSTHWTILNAAKAGDSEAMAHFLRRYWEPLVLFLQRWSGLQPSDTEDIVQSFIAEKVLEKGLLAKAEKRPTRFRAFLLTVLTRFARSWIKKNRPHIAIGGDSHEVKEETTPVESDRFDSEWAVAVFQQAIDQTRKECNDKGQQTAWLLFCERLLLPILSQTKAPSYSELIAKVEVESPAKAGGLVLTCQRKFRRILDEIVSEYCDTEDEREDEINDLIQIVSKLGAGFRDRLRVDP